MRIAVQIAGQPRFCSDLTDFIKNFRISPEDTVDWHLHLWSSNPRPDNHVNYHLTLVHDQWREPNEHKVRTVFERNLPQNHRIASVGFSDSMNFVPPCLPPQKIRCQIEHVPNVWRMWLGWQRVDQQRQQWESTHNIIYDRVVKARTDCAFTDPVDIANSDPMAITVAHKPWHGYQRRINDTLAIGSGQQISVYSSLIDCAESYVDAMGFHAETLLAYHLEQKKIPVVKGPWSIKFRTFKDSKTQEVDWGDWIP